MPTSGTNHKSAAAPPSTPARQTRSSASPLSASSQTPRHRIPQVNLFTRPDRIKENDPANNADWINMLVSGCGGHVSTKDFLSPQIMGYKTANGGLAKISEIVATCAPRRLAAREHLEKVIDNSKRDKNSAEYDVKLKRDENAMYDKFMDLLNKIVEKFPKESRPTFKDTRARKIESLKPGDHDTKPDITGLRRRLPDDALAWLETCLVVEFKDEDDICDSDNKLGTSDGAVKAQYQVAKSGRSLLSASGASFVFAITVFKQHRARLLRFDHGGWKYSESFDWTSDDEADAQVLPEFLFRLFNPPDQRRGLIAGDDDTVTPAPHDLRDRLWSFVSEHSFYGNEKEFTEEGAEKKFKGRCFLITAGLRDAKGRTYEVDCITVGQPLSISDALFSRATRVYRVVLVKNLRDAKQAGDLVFYALKDAWRQDWRRKEEDFYDLIHHHLDNLPTPPPGMDDMAKCHGTLDLSVESPRIHKTCAKTGLTDSDAHKRERCRTRTLITPVGRPLSEFPSTRALVQALYMAAFHHETAYKAGVMHRDISEGNIMFDETTIYEELPKVFLVDWDYAEFVDDKGNVGADKFKKAFPKRDQVDRRTVAESLKEFTGTEPFMAMELLDAAKDTIVQHGAHHDLESEYWLLVWMILRYTAHGHAFGEHALHAVFKEADTKFSWINKKAPLTLSVPLTAVLDEFRLQVGAQNPRAGADSAPIPRLARPGKEAPPSAPVPALAPQPVPLTHDTVLDLLYSAVWAKDWPTQDRAQPFGPQRAPPKEKDSDPDFVEPAKSRKRSGKAVSDLTSATLAMSLRSGGAASGPSGSATAAGQSSLQGKDSRQK
ncbi:Pkinase-fungal domain-containing protein [Mycena kentingensis (nom. inval.)]|nr:Pkinase-fungal domain-containing protein [Mycena kentingensis (nom. inval.)]